MRFRLLIDLEALEFLHAFSPARRRRVMEHLRILRDYPGNFSRASYLDEEGRNLDVSLFDGLAIYYWIDAADRHVKVLRIENEG